MSRSNQSPCSGKMKFAMENAISRDDGAAMRQLLLGMSPDTEVSKRREPLLIFAIKKSRWNAARVLLEHDMSYSTLDEALRLAIERVTKTSDLEQVKQVVEAGAELTGIHTILKFWSKYKNTNPLLCRLMLKSVQTYSKTKSYKRTSNVLLNAAATGALEYRSSSFRDQYTHVKILLESGADLESYCNILSAEQAKFNYMPFSFQTLSLFIRAANSRNIMIKLRKVVSAGYTWNNNVVKKEKWLQRNNDQLKQILYLFYHAFNPRRCRSPGGDHFACVCPTTLSCSAVCQEYLKMKKTPTPLQELSRATVREHLNGPNVFYCLKSLGHLPFGLRNLIAMTDWAQRLEVETF